MTDLCHLPLYVAGQTNYAALGFGTELAESLMDELRQTPFDGQWSVTLDSVANEPIRERPPVRLLVRHMSEGREPDYAIRATFSEVPSYAGYNQGSMTLTLQSGDENQTLELGLSSAAVPCYSADEVAKKIADVYAALYMQQVWHM